MKINVFQTTFRAPAERALRARARHAAAFVAALLFGGAMPALHAQTLTATGNLTEASMHHATTLLADGRVLLVKTDRKAMRFDATSDTWSAVASPTAASTNATLTRLNDGSVLRAGGYASGGAAVASVERFTANTGVWAAATTMSTARLAHTATVMADGGVLMVGGSSAVNLPRVDLASVERFDAVNGLWTAAPTLPATRTSHSATRLANGDLIVLGGYVAGTLSNTCVRLPQGAASWVPCAAMTQARAGHVSTLLADGRIFVSGGVAAASGFEEIYAWNTDSWVSTSLPARTSTSHVVFELTPGVLVLWGGAPASAYSLGTGPAPNVPGAVSYAIASGSVATLPSLPARSGHAATVLADGRALISGGFTTYAVTSSLGTLTPLRWTPATRCHSKG